MFKPHTYCRACGYAKPTGLDGIKAQGHNERLLPAFSLGLQPLANDFAKPWEERAGYAPLEVLLCPRCGLGQLSVVVRPDVLYSRYLYVTSPSETMRQHFFTIWGDMAIQRATVPRTVLEIGSNDGLLLRFALEHGAKDVLGVDPSANLGEVARKAGVPTFTTLFNQHTAGILKDCSPVGNAPELIIARHVLCHVDDWADFFAGLDMLAGPETLIAIETPYAGDTLANTEFDQVYHEHLSFLTVRAVVAVLAGTGLELVKVTRYPIHGGAVMLSIRRKGVAAIDPSVGEFLAAETDWPGQWAAFSQRAHRLVGELKGQVRLWREAGKTVAGLGASAKSTVWVNAAGFTRRDLAFIADSTPGKWYTTSPGSDIPITDEGAILRELPDYVICFAWNYAVEIAAKNALARSKGVRLVFPVPRIEIV